MWALALSLSGGLALGCGKKKTPTPTETTASPETAATETTADKSDATTTSDPATNTSAADAGTAPATGPHAGGLPEPGPRPDWKPPAVVTWSLDNGLTVWLVEQRQAPLASLQLVLPNGAASDPAGKAGLTTLMADMLDEGAGERTSLELADAFSALATNYGDSVATDGTIFGMEMLADNLDGSMALFADIVLRPTLSEVEFSRRKEQHLAGALADEADPENAAAVTLRRVLFGEHYAGYPAGGVRGTLEKVAFADLKPHYEALVKPEGAVLVVVGAVDRKTLEASVKTHLGEWEGAPATQVLAGSGKTETVHGLHIIDFPGAAQTALQIGRLAPGVDAKDEFETSVFNRALGGAFTSRINMNLREDKGYTYGARSGFMRFKNAGAYYHRTSVKSDTTRLSWNEIERELTEVGSTKPITALERDQAANGVILGFPGRFQRIASMAGQLANLAVDGRPASYYTTWASRIQAVTTEAANTAGKAYVDPASYVIVAAGDRKSIEAAFADLKLPTVVYDAQGNILTDTAGETSDK